MGLKSSPNEHNYKGRGGMFCLVAVFADAMTSSEQFVLPSLDWSRMQ